MENLNIWEHWYKAVIAAGVALGVAAVAASHTPLLIIALGMVLFGVGEFTNHPYQERVMLDALNRPQYKISGHARRVGWLGLTLDIAGGLLVIWGIVRVLMM
jgi:hypothetical protein